MSLFPAGTFNAGNRKEDTSTRGQLYKPTSKIDLGQPPSQAADPTPPVAAMARPARPGAKKQVSNL